MGISVFIVDHERTFADALAMRLDAEHDIEVVAAVHARSPGQVMILGRHADIMLLDGDLAEEAAFRLSDELTRLPDPPHIVILSSDSEPQRIIAALRAGAVAWFRKDEPLSDLIRALRSVAQGGVWLGPAETAAVLRLLLAEREQQHESDRLLSSLTPREREVLACLADGATRNEVAKRLRMSANTVRTHTQNLMSKLGVHSTLEAVAATRASRGSSAQNENSLAPQGDPPSGPVSQASITARKT